MPIGENRTVGTIKFDKTRPVHLIINPRSGYGGRKLILTDLRATLRRAGIEIVEYTTSGPEDATAHARRIADCASAVIVWGGDGTVSEVASGLVGTDVPILPCPAGTENLLASEMKIPAEPRRILNVLHSGQIVDCDLGQINGRNFLLIIGVGFDGEVVRRLAAGRTGHISHLSYFWPIWRTFWEHDFPQMHIVADREEVFHDRGLVFVGNISRYAVGLRICRDAQYDDGLLDLVVFNCRQQTALVLHAAWTLLRMHPLKGNVLYRRVRRVRIETSRPVPCQVDGDLGPNTPLDISVAPEKIKLLIPARLAGTETPDRSVSRLGDLLPWSRKGQTR
ncbi:MAG: diacylglycerol kinase family lipid kinase [Phycisphaerae bacterium]|nr:diacylglycerol kinase family lipid kinase [Phycisphaerae bacterium]